MNFVTIQTKEGDRKVSLAYTKEDGQVRLLGSLLHNTRLLIDQTLVDELQSLVNNIQEQEIKMKNPNVVDSSKTVRQAFQTHEQQAALIKEDDKNDAALIQAHLSKEVTITITEPPEGR